MTLDAKLLDLFATNRHGSLITLKRDGRPQSSVLIHRFDPGTSTVSMSVTDTRAKVRNLRRDPRASYQVTSGDGWSYAVAEGAALLGPVAQDPHDEGVEQLIDLYRSLAGEHPDWDDYRRAMVAEQRLVLTIPIERVYGMTRG